MPKKKKCAQKDQADDGCPPGGRPGRLTLGDFLSAQIAQSCAIKEKSGQSSKTRATQPNNYASSVGDIKKDKAESARPVLCEESVHDIKDEIEPEREVLPVESVHDNKDEGEPEQAVPPEEPVVNSTRVKVAGNVMPYFVCRTKKGGLPVKVENRSSGKKVTLIEHVRGDGKLFVHNMKMKFGTGGLFKDDTIELQGDCKLKVTKFLNENKNLLKPFGTK